MPNLHSSSRRPAPSHARTQLVSSSHFNNLESGGDFGGGYFRPPGPLSSNTSPLCELTPVVQSAILARGESSPPPSFGEGFTSTIDEYMETPPPLDVDPPFSRKRPRSRSYTFPFEAFATPSCPANFCPIGPFRENVLAFVDAHASVEPEGVDGMDAWSCELELSCGSMLMLLIIEEFTEDNQLPHCDQCRCIGWSHHPVSSRRYHFVIPAEDVVQEMSRNRQRKDCPTCGAGTGDDMNGGLSEPCERCLNSGGVASDNQGATPLVSHSLIRDQRNFLHGVIHSNGFGHLLKTNGREGGSSVLAGKDVMELWDRLCAMLRARKISVEDVSQKHGMEYRVLHSVAHGKPWYGQWYYEFGQASFNRSRADYSRAVRMLRQYPLKSLVHHFQKLQLLGVDEEVTAIVAQYQRLSNNGLDTLGYLLKFMIQQRASMPLHGPCKAKPKPLNGASPSSPNQTICDNAEGSCRWAPKRLEEATRVIVDVLKSAGMSKWVPRQEVRDQCRQKIGDTGLLDYVLKSMGGRIIGELKVSRELNQLTKVLEYSIGPAATDSRSSGGPIHRGFRYDPNGGLAALGHPARSERRQLGRATVLKDIVCIYKNVLEFYKPLSRGVGGEVSKEIARAVQIILDSKHFIKDYRGEMPRSVAEGHTELSEEDDFKAMRVLIQLELEDHLHHDRHRPPPPPELLVLSGETTMGGLKQAAEKAFRNTYKVMEYLKVDVILDMDADDSEILFGSIESGTTIRVLGRGVDITSEWRYEGGNEAWVVSCTCGIRDDDGERMIACDMCAVWQHTRCGGIPDSSIVPPRFLCAKCRARRMPALKNVG